MKDAILREATPNGRCLESHPALDIAGFKVYGGSCHSPMVTNADIYVSLDGWGGDKHQPWNGPTQSVSFRIADMHAPQDPEEFKRFIKWLHVQLVAHDKLIHIGCIGGHGRTGTVLSALVKEMTGDSNATQYVRDHYCQKAVESMAQVKFLEKEFGITPVAPAKTFPAASSAPAAQRWGQPATRAPSKSMMPRMELPSKPFTVEPARKSIKSLWGTAVQFNEAQNVL